MRRFRNILFYADGSTDASSALRRAVKLAEGNGARLTVLDVIEPVDTPREVASRFAVDLNELLKERRLAALDAMIAPFRRDEAMIYTQVLRGVGFIEVIRAVLRNGFDLVVKPARPPAAFSERVFGSTDMHLLRKCPCPVWIDHAAAEPSYRQVLAAVDPLAGDPGCDRLVMDLATSLAAREGAGLAVVHAWRLEGESMLRHGRLRMPRTELEDLLRDTEHEHRAAVEGLLSLYDLAADGRQVHLVKDDPAPAIRRVAERLAADVIVMGTVGRSGVPGFFIGNTAEEVLQTTTASVLAVKPDGFVTPVT